MPRLDQSKAGIKISRRIINNLRYADDTILMAEIEKELKTLLMRVEEESEESWLKTQHSKTKDHGIWSHHSMANRWGNNRNSEGLYFGGLQNHCRWCIHEIKRHLLLGRKAMTNLDSILKTRDIILLMKVHLVKALVFPVVIHGRESWTIKKAEH